MMPKPTFPLFLTFLFSLVLLFSSVQAKGCRLGGSLCGTIYNQSPWTLLYTTNPSPDDHCTSCCYFWNWNNGGKRDQQTTCTQRSLAKKQPPTAGKGVDVDGFTYADRDYYYSGIKIKKGVWTKFASIQTVRKGGWLKGWTETVSVKDDAGKA
ncbi:hypothetical protein FRC04_003130 [Tulasnella sp. 424]|nr:hypothetical protein FRC04_003130 [Tulasnella sp. 424]KAG8967525.1 hypothetical protein FRC05_002037 [Tulasnella sp. 425]